MIWEIWALLALLGLLMGLVCWFVSNYSTQARVGARAIAIAGGVDAAHRMLDSLDSHNAKRLNLALHALAWSQHKGE